MHQDKRKKVIFVIPSLVGGGAERVLVNILKYLDRGRFNPHLVLFENKGEFLNQVPKEVTIYDLKKRNRFDFFKLIILLAYKIYPEVNPDIVVSFLEYANIVTIISKNLSPIKPATIISEHSYITKYREYQRKNRLRALLMKTLYPQADKIISVSKGVAEDLMEYCRITRKIIRVICNGIDLKHINNSINEAHNFIIEISDNTPAIIACGRLTRPKNYHLLIRAFDKVQNQVVSKLLILGQGEERFSLEKLSRELGIQDKVKFLGFQINPFKYIVRSDIFVLSSDWEGFGNVILEAMACGTPVISTRCPSGPEEIITDGVNGLLVPVGNVDALVDAMLHLLRDEPLRKKFAEAGKKRAEDFRVEKMVAEYEKLFEEVISAKSG